MENKTEAIYDYLFEEIRKNKYMVNYRLPSEIKLSSLFNCSRMSAQLAYKKLSNENMVILRRGSGAYINSQFILNMQNMETPTGAKIALIFPIMVSKFLDLIYRCVYYELNKLGIIPYFFFSDNTKTEEKLLNLIKEKKFDGLIFYPIESNKTEKILKDLIEEQFPLVLIDRYYKDINTYTVSSNHFASSYKLVENFFNAGRRKICFVTEPLLITSLQHRYNGYITALSHYPVLKEKSSIVFYDNLKPEDSATKLKEIIDTDSVDAIITTSGCLANQVIEAVKNSKKIIGKDILLALYDEEVSFDEVISFSYIKLIQDTEKIGKQSVSILMDLLCKKPIKQKDNKIETKLIMINTR